MRSSNKLGSYSHLRLGFCFYGQRVWQNPLSNASNPNLVPKKSRPRRFSKAKLQFRLVFRLLQHLDTVSRIVLEVQSHEFVERLQYHSIRFTAELTPDQQTVILDLFLNMIQTLRIINPVHPDQVQEASIRLEGLYEIHFQRLRNCVVIYPKQNAMDLQLLETIDSLARVCNPTNEHY